MHPHPRLLLAAAFTLLVAACSGSATTPTGGSVAETSRGATSTPPAMAGTPVPEAPSASPTTDGMDAYPLLASYAGHFGGAWNNTTFATTGPMTWDITANEADRTIRIVVAVGGRFFGGPGGPAETILLTNLADGVIAGTSPLFGEISGTITPDGTLAIMLDKVPGGVVAKVEVSGRFSDGDTITMDYAVTFAAGGTAAGTVALARA